MTDPNESTDLPDLRRLLEGVVALARAAAVPIARVYATDFDVRHKDDRSPVTEADTAAEEVIVAGLRELSPAIPIVSEEATGSARPEAPGSRFWLVDPLDGTLEFVRRNGEFTINIALVEDGRPTAGAVYAPAIARLWFGGERAFVCAAAVGSGLPKPSAWRAIRARPAPPRLVALASRSHANPQTEAFLEMLPIAERLARGSSLKFCAIAEGSADVYPRFGPTMEWDTAAGDAVLRAAGGVVLTLSGEPLVYGKVAEGLRNPPFVAWGDVRAAQILRER